MTRRKTQEEFIAELNKVNPNIVTTGQYVNNHTKVLCLCKKCGHSWYAVPNALLQGYGCPKCAGNIKKSNEDFCRELSKISPNIEPLEPYKNSKTAILCKCKVCGNEWMVTPNNLLSKKHQCPQCSHTNRGLLRRKTNTDFKKELSIINPNIIPLDSYTTSQRKIRCQCKKCGHIWTATPNNLLDKHSCCPQCSHSSTSTIEQIIVGTFIVILGKEAVKPRDRTAIGKELDVYIPSLNFAIEFGAWYWHRNKIKKDNEKQRLCKENDIFLLTIYEDCPLDIDSRLEGNYKLYPYSIGNEADYHTIKELLKQICIENDISADTIIDENWQAIVKHAISNSQKKTSEDFKKELYKNSPSIVLLDPYTKSDIKVQCKCKTCGNEWSVLPTSLLLGHGCPKCARKTAAEKKTITNDEFVSRLSKLGTSVEPLDPYVKGDLKIRCRCKKCGNIWSAKPNLLLQGRACPKCGRASSSRKHSKPIRCVETGVCYSSIAEVYRSTGISNAHKCAKGYQKTAGGYHWEYIE